MSCVIIRLDRHRWRHGDFAVVICGKEGDKIDMTRVVYVSASGDRETVVAPNGYSLMEAAINNSIEGIDGDCGGACSCGTCHVYVDEEWIDKVPPPGDIESDMLDAVERRCHNSRLACQIKISPELDMLVVTVATS